MAQLVVKFWTRRMSSKTSVSSEQTWDFHTSGMPFFSLPCPKTDNGIFVEGVFNCNVGTTRVFLFNVSCSRCRPFWPLCITRPPNSRTQPRRQIQDLSLPRVPVTRSAISLPCEGFIAVGPDSQPATPLAVRGGGGIGQATEPIVVVQKPLLGSSTRASRCPTASSDCSCGES